MTHRGILEWARKNAQLNDRDNPEGFVETLMEHFDTQQKWDFIQAYLRERESDLLLEAAHKFYEEEKTREEYRAKLEREASAKRKSRHLPTYMREDLK